MEIKNEKRKMTRVQCPGFIMFKYDSVFEIKSAIKENLYNSGVSLSYRKFDEQGNTTELHIFYF